ncbi:hypothetical protein [Desulfoluna butyratoxydans]|uniref:Elwxxdgt repeat n=1 Tax=Desulfoluna butyratoxydans TaxID=231438 RepID=A0A4U8YVA9_9BACT|nr:hypothetical protein [Desulfoluna butyratoxydans]VFQ45323.1 elwxxdgt repeat [Desulfoluna butyratoxydans]
MFKFIHASLHRFIIPLMIVVFMAGCGGGNSTEDPPPMDPSVPLQDPDGVLSSIGLTTNKAVKEKVSETGLLGLTVELRNENPTLPTEKIISILKENNKNIEYKKLAAKGVPEGVISRIKALPYSPVATQAFVQLPDPDIFPISASSDALVRLNREKQKKLNRRLWLQSQAPLTMDEFLALQNAFGSTKMVNNFGNLDQKTQNVAVRQTRHTKAFVDGPSDGVTLVNAVDELKENGGIGETPSGANPCNLVAMPSLPMAIASTEGPVETLVVSSEGGDAVISFPETGIAVIQASREVTLEDSSGKTLCSAGGAEPRFYYLPVTRENRCKPFRFVGASSTVDITLVEMITPERLSDTAFVEGDAFLTSGSAADLLNPGFRFAPKSFTFSTLNSHLEELDLSFQIETESPDTANLTFVLYSPSGAIYTGDKNGLAHAVDRDTGIWRLDILPLGSVGIAENALASLAPAGDMPDTLATFTITPLITSEATLQTKEFVLGTVKNISLKTQGEEGTYNEGEITVDLNTSMSPNLTIPTYMDDILAGGDKLNDTLGLWQAWIKSEKTGHEFEADGELVKFKAQFERQKELYETEHTFDYQNNPEVYECRDEDGQSATCIRGELGPYNMPEPIPDDFKARVVMRDFSKKMQHQYQDVEYLHMLTNYYDLYQHWKERTVQVDTAQFPYDGVPYKTHEFMTCPDGDLECVKAVMKGETPRIPVIIQVNRPIFGVPVDRMVQSTQPITFDYTASDQDVYDTSAANWAFLGYLASQTFNVISGNFVGFVCETVNLVDDLHDVELAAQDDPLGSARASINRYTSSDPFYGLHNQSAFSFFMSGVPEENTEVDTYGQKLSYAQIACDCVNLASSGYQFAKNADMLLSLDYEELGSAADVYKVIAGTSAAAGAADIMADAHEIAGLIQAGEISQARARLATSTNINALSEGRDLYNDLDSLLTNYQNTGSAGNGNNVLKSNAKYLLGTDRKTRAEVEFRRVSSVPVTRLEVTLDRVKIISNYEEKDDTAEIRMYPYVGVVSDKPGEGDTLHALFTESEDIRTNYHGWDYLRFNGVKDGQELDTQECVLYTGGGYNAAAVYVELAVMEDDGISVEDDDMIGVFSQTIRLEEIFNKHAEFKWEFLGGNDYRLHISEYPIYNSSNQLCLENPLSRDHDFQKTHNRNRRPSALVSLTVNLSMGDLSTPHPKVDTSLDVGILADGHDTYSMNMKPVASIPATGQIQDAWNGAAIVGNTLRSADLIAYGVGPYFLTNIGHYTISEFTGALLPIAETLRSPKTIHRTELPMVRLLDGNRILFAISHHDGARLMVVKYSDTGALSLEKSVLIKDASGNQVYTLLKPAISPDRSRLLVPFVPPGYAASDKKATPETEVNLYEITLGGTTEITRRSTTSFGANAPLTSLAFIDETHVAAMTRTLLFGDGKNPWWPNGKTIQSDCSSASLDCLFDMVGQDLLLYDINDSNRFELTDALDIFYEPTEASYTPSSLRLGGSLFVWHPWSELSCVAAVQGSSAMLKVGATLYQLEYDTTTKAYYFGDQSTHRNARSLRYNPEGGYYCTDGLACSGYLKSALKADKNDPDVYRSTEGVRRFEFADTDRDLALGFSGINTLSLLSLYDGFAYKGPNIIGDILDTLVRVGSSTPYTFSFTVTDRDTPLAGLTITARIENVTVPGGYTETTLTDIVATPNANGGYDCTATLTPGALDPESTLTQRVVITVTDGTYTSEKEFTIYHRPFVLIPFADGIHGTEIWKTDGITAAMLNDANPTGDVIHIGYALNKFGGRYVFQGTGEDGESQPFTATASQGAAPLKPGIQDTAYTPFATLGDRAFFRTARSSTETTLWETDGTAGGTTEVKALSGGKIQQIKTLGSTLFIHLNGSSSSNPDSLWKSNGTEGGTTQVKGPLAIEGHLIPCGDKLFFASDDMGGNGCGLWVSDGTPDGTQRLKATEHPPWYLTDIDGVLYFYDHYQTRDAEDYTVDHLDLWKSDGTPEGTEVVKEMAQRGSFDPTEMFVVEGSLYIARGHEIWASDGTEDGTTLINDLSTLPDFTLGRVRIEGKVQVVGDTFYFRVRRYSEPYGDQIFAIQPGVDHERIKVSERSQKYTYITMYKEPAGGNEFLFASQDDDHVYLWKHTVDDGTTLIKTTDR